MVKNYLKIAFRNILRHKGYSFINIAGLAVGMAVCILILLWVQDELSYDRFHKNHDDIYRVIQIWRKGGESHNPVTPAALAPALKEEFPEIVNAARFRGVGRILLKCSDHYFYEQGGAFTDPAAFSMFTFPFVKGNPQTALSNPHSIVLTEPMARKYFGEENPVGKTIEIKNLLQTTTGDSALTDMFTVTGVLKNIPGNSHLQFDFLLPLHLLDKSIRMDWHNTIYFTYVQLGKDTVQQDVEQKIYSYLQKPDPNSTASLYLQPLNRIHLYSEFSTDVAGQGSIKIVIIVSIIAFSILLIACINFMNLATARSSNRAKEVGVRKVAGARKADLVKQFFSEAFLLSLIALFFSLLLVELLLPAFNQLTRKELSLDFAGNGTIFLMLVGVGLVTGVIAGSYPALFLSSFKPVNVLKGVLKTGFGIRGSFFRKTLVITQFSLTIILIIGTVVLYKQLNYIQDRKLGFDKEQLIYIPLNTELRQKYEAVKSEWLQNPDIISVTAASSLPSFGRDIYTEDVHWEGKTPDQDVLMNGISIGYDFVKTFKIDVVEGRHFSTRFPADQSNFVVNEAAIKVMGMKNPVGQKFTFGDRTGTIIGVVKNYHFKSLRQQIEPLVLRLSPEWVNYLFVRLKPGNVSDTIDRLEEKWEKTVPGYPFEYYFVDDLLNNLYTVEQQVGKVLRGFTFLAVIIAALGLFGLASFMAEQRTKEIGIRKVLGSSTLSVVALLSKEFCKWVLAANVIAWPIAFFAVDWLLQVYAYRTPIGIAIFLLSGGFALAIAFLTVCYQSLKAALANPVEALRYE
jgi:ABC-type antimicrobial peptide transport system permease subunit